MKFELDKSDIMPESYFNGIAYLVKNNPNKYISQSTIYIKITNWEDILKITTDFYPLHNAYYMNSSKNCALYEVDTDARTSRIKFMHTEDFDVEGFKKLFEHLKPEPEEGYIVNLIGINNGMARTIPKRSKKKIIIDEENSYNLTCPIKDIYDIIESDKSGLILFHSSPGSGKSSLIKYLCQKCTDVSFFFLSNSNLEILSNPSFVEYCLLNMNNAVLILEDCEKALTTRNINKGYDISNILNITDGIFGDLLNVKIIATLNTTDTLDPALLRKGRLLKKVQFNALMPHQVEALSTSLGNPIKTDKEMMLCDVYNTMDNGTQTKERREIGFKQLV